MTYVLGIMIACAEAVQVSFFRTRRRVLRGADCRPAENQACFSTKFNLSSRGKICSMNLSTVFDLCLFAIDDLAFLREVSLKKGMIKYIIYSVRSSRVF